METAGDAAKFAQLLMDPTGEGLFPVSMLVPYVGAALREIRNEITNRAVTATLEEVVIPGFPGGAENLDAYTAVGGVLAAMVIPVKLEEKPAGTPDENYTPVLRVEALPERPQSDRLRDYQWLGDRVQFVSATQDLDLKVRFETDWPDATEVSTPMPLRGLVPATGRWVSAMVAEAMDQAPAATLRAAKARHALYKWINNRVLDSQRVPRRQQPFRRPVWKDGFDGLV